MHSIHLCSQMYLYYFSEYHRVVSCLLKWLPVINYLHTTVYYSNNLTIDNLLDKIALWRISNAFSNINYNYKELHSKKSHLHFISYREFYVKLYNIVIRSIYLHYTIQNTIVVSVLKILRTGAVDFQKRPPKSVHKQKKTRKTQQSQCTHFCQFLTVQALIAFLFGTILRQLNSKNSFFGSFPSFFALKTHLCFTI